MTIKLSSCIMHMRILNFLQGSKLYVACLMVEKTTEGHLQRIVARSIGNPKL